MSERQQIVWQREGARAVIVRGVLLFASAIGLAIAGFALDFQDTTLIGLAGVYMMMAGIGGFMITLIGIKVRLDAGKQLAVYDEQHALPEAIVVRR